MSLDMVVTYNVLKHIHILEQYTAEDDTAARLGYHGSYDLAQGTGFQSLANAVGNR